VDAVPGRLPRRAPGGRGRERRALRVLAAVPRHVRLQRLAARHGEHARPARVLAHDAPARRRAAARHDARPDVRDPPVPDDRAEGPRRLRRRQGLPRLTSSARWSAPAGSTTARSASTRTRRSRRSARRIRGCCSRASRRTRADAHGARRLRAPVPKPGDNPSRSAPVSPSATTTRTAGSRTRNGSSGPPRSGTAQTEDYPGGIRETDVLNVGRRATTRRAPPGAAPARSHRALRQAVVGARRSRAVAVRRHRLRGRRRAPARRRFVGVELKPSYFRVACRNAVA
jgi:hypothetical protein